MDHRSAIHTIPANIGSLSHTDFTSRERVSDDMNGVGESFAISSIFLFFWCHQGLSVSTSTGLNVTFQTILDPPTFKVVGPTYFGGWSYKLTTVHSSVSVVLFGLFSKTGLRIFLIFA